MGGGENVACPNLPDLIELDHVGSYRGIDTGKHQHAILGGKLGRVLVEDRQQRAANLPLSLEPQDHDRTASGAHCGQEFRHGPRTGVKKTAVDIENHGLVIAQFVRGFGFDDVPVFPPEANDANIDA